MARTQEFTLRYSRDNGQSFHEIVRQQWNFSPHGSTTELEEYQVDLSEVTTLETHYPSTAQWLQVNSP